MTDLGRLEVQLNTDAALREEFLRDPVAVLSRMGIWLSSTQQQDIRRQVAKVNVQRPTVLSGSANVPAARGAVRLHLDIWTIG
jgi:hypothetical protein